MRRHTTTLSAGLVLSLAAVPAAAQSAPETAALALEPVVVTADKTEKRVTDTLAPVSVRGGEELERWQPSSVQDLLQGVPGVTVGLSPGGGPGAKINIRGLEDFGRVNVMIDGTRQNFQRSGHSENTMVFVDPELIERVEVVRGPTAAIYGSGAIGGVVNFVTRDAADLLRPGRTLGATVTARAGSNANERAGTAAAYGKIDWADVVVMGSATTRDDYDGGDGTTVDHSAWDQTSGLAKLTLTPADGHTVRFSVMQSESEYESGTSATDDLTTTVETYKAEYRLTPPDQPLIDLTANLYYTTTEQDETRVDGSLAGRETEVTVETPGFDLFNTSRFMLASTGHALTYGIDGFQDSVEATRAGGPLDFTPAGDRRLIGGFVQDEIALTERLTLIGALRFDDYELDGGGVESSDDALSPKITAGYEVLDGFTLYGSWARAFRAPSITETLINGRHPAPASFAFVPNPDLKPETAETWEAGVNVAQDDLFRPGDRLRVKASIYTSTVDDYIEEYTNIVMGPRGPNWAASTYGYENVAEASLHGAELEVSYDAGFAYASLGLTHARGKNETTGERLSSGLGDRATLVIGGRERDLGLDFGWRMTGRRGLDVAHADDPTTSTDDPAGGFLLHGAYVTYTPPQLDDAVTLRLTAENIFDVAYREDLALAEPEPGRTITVGGTVRF